MERRDTILAAMSPAGTGQFTPVRIQKLLFLIDRNIARDTDGPHFQFEPYHYGPFDKDVYRELTMLEQSGSVEIVTPRRMGPRTYQLTDAGLMNGDAALARLPKDAQRYIRELVSVVRSMTFSQLVSAIYDAYPDMKVNSVFSQPPS